MPPTRRPTNTRFPSNEIDFGRIITALTNSKMQTENNALYQSVFQLVNGTQSVETRVNNKLDVDADIPATQITGLPIFQEGKYLPNFTAGANVDALGNFYLHWYRFFNQITVWGKITLDATAGAPGAEVFTDWEMDLPIRGRFQFAEQLSCVWNAIPFAGATSSFGGIAYGSPVSGNAVFSCYANNDVDNDVRLQLTYLLIPKEQ